MWTLNLALLVAALVLLLQLVLQGSSAGEAERLALEYEAGSGDVPWGWNSWSLTAWEAWGVSLVHTLILQDGAKVVLVALVSPLVLPSLLPPERQSWRARACCGSSFGCSSTRSRSSPSMGPLPNFRSALSTGVSITSQK